MNRRDFVVCSASTAAGIGVAAIGLRAHGDASLQGPRRPLPYKVIFDTRYRASRAFGDQAAKLGLALRPIAGDVTSLWFRELQPLWARCEGAVVGMTTCASLLCLEQLARDHWMRVVARVEHRRRSDGMLCHRLFLPRATLRSANLALAQREHWAEGMISPLVARLANKHSGRAVESVVLTADRSREDPGITLVSWVIATRPSRGEPI